MLAVSLIVFFQVSEVVIGFAMADFIGADSENHFPEGGIRIHHVIFNCCRWRFLCGELWQLAPINLFDELSVSMHSLLFQVANKPVAEARRDQIHHEVDVSEKKLCRNNTESESITWPTLLIKEKQMHPFIFCLF